MTVENLRLAHDQNLAGLLEVGIDDTRTRHEDFVDLVGALR